MERHHQLSLCSSSKEKTGRPILEHFQDQVTNMLKTIKYSKQEEVVKALSNPMALIQLIVLIMTTQDNDASTETPVDLCLQNPRYIYEFIIIDDILTICSTDTRFFSVLLHSKMTLSSF